MHHSSHPSLAEGPAQGLPLSQHHLFCPVFPLCFPKTNSLWPAVTRSKPQNYAQKAYQAAIRSPFVLQKNLSFYHSLAPAGDGHQAVQPPSTRRICPVTKREASEAR